MFIFVVVGFGFGFGFGRFGVMVGGVMVLFIGSGTYVRACVLDFGMFGAWRLVGWWDGHGRTRVKLVGVGVGEGGGGEGEGARQTTRKYS